MIAPVWLNQIINQPVKKDSDVRVFGISFGYIHNSETFALRTYNPEHQEEPHAFL